MSKTQTKLRFVLNTAFALVALVIIIDFIVPGKIVNDEIINVQAEREQYNNAAGNSHYSYKLVTNENSFSVSEEFARTVEEHEEIEYSVSRIFQEVNWYRLHASENKASNSLRIILGLLLPLLVIASIVVANRFKKNIGIVVFVLQVLLIGDLVFLLM